MTSEPTSSESRKKCRWDSPKEAKDEGSTGVLLETDANVQQYLQIISRAGCLCARTFTSEKFMKIHKSKKGCTHEALDVQQRTFTTDAGESSDGQGQSHSTMNSHVVLSGETTPQLFCLKRQTGLPSKDPMGRELTSTPPEPT